MVKEEITPTLYKRKITHTEYRHGDKKTKKGGWSRMLHHHITDNKVSLSQEWLDSKGNFLQANDKFLEKVESSYLTPIWGGGFFLLIIIIIIIGGFKFPDEISSIQYIVPSILAFLGFLFFLFYYFTMPKKEAIWNREDGLVTFPGFMWRPNITMPIEKLVFVMSSPSPQGGGAYELQIARPDRSYSLYHSFIGYNCYEDLSFLLWYMDKNRPLPPGTAFDPYRDRDFERRKAAGFPPPIFVSAFDTPEATPEQQSERERIGGW